MSRMKKRDEKVKRPIWEEMLEQKNPEQESYDDAIRACLEADVQNFMMHNFMSEYAANLDSWVTRRMRFYGFEQEDLLVQDSNIQKLCEVIFDVKLIDPMWDTGDPAVRALVYIDLLLNNIAVLFEKLSESPSF